MSSTQPTVTIPNVSLTLDQLLTAIRQLDEPARIQVARILLETDLDAKMMALIRRLAERKPVTQISDAMIVAEVRAVREQRRKAP
ncbi:MAG TPA: hypothetical protein VI547_03020 [Anaerolineales bacterium]|nr:hypothetical protein [Anaerolineales bacterium]